MHTITRSANDLLRLMIDRMDQRRRMEDLPSGLLNIDDPEMPFEMELDTDEPLAAVRSVFAVQDGHNKPDVHGMLRSYVRHDLSDRELELVEMHLGICEECSAYVESLRALNGERLVIPLMVVEPSFSPIDPAATSAQTKLRPR